jgi:hypothetical protein
MDFAQRHSSTEYNVSTIVETIEDGVAHSRVAVKWNRHDGVAPREQFLVIAKSSDKASGLVFKAILRTFNSRHTPTLDGYEIRIAE